MRDAGPLLALRRHIVHGALATVKAHRGAFVFARLDLEPDGYRISHYKLNLRHYPEIATRLSRLVVKAGRLSHALLESV
jgi:hypothetical protein